MPSKVRIIPIGELSEMHTGTLMARRRALLACEESIGRSDRDPSDCASGNTGIIEFKDTKEWAQAYKDLKTVLANREHVPNKEERKALRQLKARKRR